VITVTSQDIPGVTGNITLTPNPNPVVAGQQITSWACNGSISPNYRPGSCK